MRRRDFVAAGAFSAIGVSLSRAWAQSAGVQSDDALELAVVKDAVGLRLSGLMEEYSVPGASLVLFRRGTVVQSWFGRKDRSRPRDPVDGATVFEAASMSKPVFAYAVMKLCERGVLDLDIPLTHYTSKRYLDGDARLDAITARHVLSHTTGFQNWRSEDEPLSIHFTPGQRFEYSGEGYSYLQSVVTEITGTPIEEYMQAHLFAPFGMTSSGYVWRDLFERNTATPHDSEGFPMVKKKPTPADAARYASAGDLHTTAMDYARFVIEVVDPKPRDDFRLGPQSLAEMLRPQVAVGDGYGTQWALGWRIPRQGIIAHSGDNVGFHCWAVASTISRSGFVIMTNGERGGEMLLPLLMDERLNRFLEI
jgi:CubicO group peptidase (beta-lactamase class C family)